MAKASSILGLNARNHLFQSRYNKKTGREIADSKLLTKKFLAKNKIITPKLFGAFTRPEEVPAFNWGGLDQNFVIKPAEGYGGGGIIIIKRRISTDEFLTVNNLKIGIDDLKLHVLDILEGHYSINSLPGTALIEERILIHSFFKRITYQGTPDVRVVVFNRIPVMAMLRLPTSESSGKANLHQGAIGVGIDIASGKTTNAVWHDQVIRLLPGKNIRLSGLEVPHWEKLLLTAISIQIKIKSLNYMAVDFVIDEVRGPMVLELTARPGLGIQIANMGGLRRRLERVEGVEVDSPEKGVRIAKDLFGARPGGSKRDELTILENIEVLSSTSKRIKVLAKMDTGARRSSVDREFARKLGLLKKKNILWKEKVQSALGKQYREVIGITIWLGGKKIVSTATVANREGLRTRVLVGARDLKGYVIKP